MLSNEVVPVFLNPTPKIFMGIAMPASLLSSSISSPPSSLAETCCCDGISISFFLLRLVCVISNRLELDVMFIPNHRSSHKKKYQTHGARSNDEQQSSPRSRLKDARSPSNYIMHHMDLYNWWPWQLNWNDSSLQLTRANVRSDLP